MKQQTHGRHAQTCSFNDGCQQHATQWSALLHNIFVFILFTTRERPSIKNMMVGCCSSQSHWRWTTQGPVLSRQSTEHLENPNDSTCALPHFFFSSLVPFLFVAGRERTDWWKKKGTGSNRKREIGISQAKHVQTWKCILLGNRKSGQSPKKAKQHCFNYRHSVVSRTTWLDKKCLISDIYTIRTPGWKLLMHSTWLNCNKGTRTMPKCRI